MKKSLVDRAADQRTEALGVLVGQLLWRDALGAGRIGDGLAVLVGAGQEEDLLAALAVVAREHVGGDRRVRVAEVRRRIDVVDRRRDVKALHGHEAIGPACAPRRARSPRAP